MIDRIKELLGGDESFLDYSCKGIPRKKLHLPGPDFIERAVLPSDRPTPVLKSLRRLFGSGRLADTGYLSILPVDQGVEHSAGASFAPNTDYFDSSCIMELAMEGGCNAVASTAGKMGSVARKYAHRIPFIVKLNHNELLTYPNFYDQTPFAGVRKAWDMGASGIGATVYFGSAESRRQIREVSEMFEHAHELGMFTVLWCYLRNENFKTDDVDYQKAADLTGQANYLGATIGADIIKQKQPECTGGFRELDFGKTDRRIYEDLAPDHPIEWTRYQVANCFMGRAGLINSGGASADNDLGQVIKTAVINKRAGGMGLITGRKAFQKPMKEGIELLNAVQDVYLCEEVTVA